jgi:hypothetical protein
MTDMKQGTAAVDFMDNLGSVLEQLWSSKPGSEDWSPYSQDLVFQDPLQRTTGLAAYKASLSLLKNSSLFGLPIMQVATLQVHVQISEALTHRTTHRSTTRPSLAWIVSGACDISPYGAGTTTCHCCPQPSIPASHTMRTRPHPRTAAAGRGGRSLSRSGHCHGGRESCGLAHPTTPSAPPPLATPGCAAGPAPTRAARRLHCRENTGGRRSGSRCAAPGTVGPGPTAHRFVRACACAHIERVRARRRTGSETFCGSVRGGGGGGGGGIRNALW